MCSLGILIILECVCVQSGCTVEKFGMSIYVSLKFSKLDQLNIDPYVQESTMFMKFFC